MTYLHTEQILKEWFKEGSDELGIEPALFYKLVEIGFQRCPEEWECDSRDISGESCSCIRATFKNEGTYELYKELRERYLLGKMIKEATDGRDTK